MANYRYQSSRHSYRSTGRRWNRLGWAVAVVVVVILAWNGLFGTKHDKTASKDRNAEITLAGGNANTNAAIPSVTVEGRELTARDCTKSVGVATTTKSYVTLTLDVGGSVVGDAQQVAGVLKDQNIPATLFANGAWAEANPDALKAYAEAGIDVLNRGFSRATYTTLTAAQIDSDLEQAEAAISGLTAKTTKPYFRPPLGETTEAVVTEVKKQGYCPITWTVDALDTQNGMTVEAATQRVGKALRKGAIILMHANSDIALQLAPALAQEARTQGYTLVTLRDLLRIPASGTNTNTSLSQNLNANRSN